MEKYLLSDFNLHGAVKQSVEQTTFTPLEGSPPLTTTITRTYSRSGRLLEEQTKQTNGPEYVTRYTYDPAGRLIRRTSDNWPGLDSTYDYDGEGRLLSIGSDPARPGTTYEYNGARRMRRVEHLPVFTLGPNQAVGGFQWESGDIAYPPPSGGTVTTSYEEDGRPIGAEIRDDRGVVIMRVLRHYDEKGRIEADELISEDVDRPLPKEFPNEFNDAQRKAILRLMNRAFGTSKSTYKYDERGRVIEKRINGRASGDEVTSIHYNDHGDVIDEVVVRTPNPEMRIEFSLDVSGDMVPKGPPRDEPPMRSEVRYEYEYDAQGNWTKKSTAWRSESNTDFKESTVVPRMITYY